MEDENGLELSLALPSGGSSAVSKGKSGSSSDTKIDESDRGRKLINDFKNFLHGGTPKQDFDMGSQRSDLVKPHENFFSDLSKAAVDVDASTKLNSGGFWVANDNRSTEVEEEKRLEAGNKRKNLFDDINYQKKRDREAHHADLHDKSRTSHISITTDDGSTAENEDVADSEADGSTSRLMSHYDDGSKRYNGGGGLSEVREDVRAVSDSNGVNLQGQKMVTISSEKDFKLGNMTYSVPFQDQSVKIMNMPYSLPMKESNPVSVPSTSSYTLPGMMQVTAVNKDRSGAQPVMSANLPMMFGYSSIQLPVLDKDISRGSISHPQQLQPSSADRGPSNSEKQSDRLKISQVLQHKSSEAMQYDGMAIERAKGDGKRHAAEEGASSQQVADVKGGSSMVIRAKDAFDQPKTEGFTSEYPSIRPGVAADLKFGGCGSYPNLPWVSTTGAGPNGRTISGVTYRYSKTQICVVCACHGSHMSPEEFVLHASEDQTNPDSATGLVIAK